MINKFHTVSTKTKKKDALNSKPPWILSRSPKMMDPSPSVPNSLGVIGIQPAFTQPPKIHGIT